MWNIKSDDNNPSNNKYDIELWTYPDIN
jgi:hypothetical protein